MDLASNGGDGSALGRRGLTWLSWESNLGGKVAGEFVCSYLRPCLAHAGHIGTDRSLLTGHDALLLRQIARIFYMHYHTDMITHGRPLLNQSSVPGTNLDGRLDRQRR